MELSIKTTTPSTIRFVIDDERLSRTQRDLFCSTARQLEKDGFTVDLCWRSKEVTLIEASVRQTLREKGIAIFRDTEKNSIEIYLHSSTFFFPQSSRFEDSPKFQPCLSIPERPWYN